MAGEQKPQEMVLGARSDNALEIVLANGKTMDAVDMSSFRRSPGKFLENALHGRTFAIVRKSQVLCVISPPPSRKATLEELEAILSGEADTSILGAEVESTLPPSGAVTKRRMD